MLLSLLVAEKSGFAPHDGTQHAELEELAERLSREAREALVNSGAAGHSAADFAAPNQAVAVAGPARATENMATLELASPEAAQSAVLEAALEAELTSENGGSKTKPQSG